jgi:filamentous hemagglutinin
LSRHLRQAGRGTPREMPATTNQNESAEDFARGFFDGQKPGDAIPTKDGGWRAQTSDGTWVTYRPAGQASGKTLPTTASVDVNGPGVNLLNGGPNSTLKLKFPQTGSTGPGGQP